MGGGTILRSAAAKVARIGSGNAGLRGLPSSAASQSLLRSAGAVSAQPAALSAQGGLEETVTAVPAVVQWNQWNVDDWEDVVTVAEVVEGSGEPMPRVVFVGAPSLEEAKAATNDLKDAIDMLYSSKSEDKLAESVDSAVSTVASGAVTSYALPNHAVQAFKLLSQSPAAQDVVASIASDANVWDAFLQNEALKDFMRSQSSGGQFPLMDLKPDESVDDSASEDWKSKSPTKLEETSNERSSSNKEDVLSALLHKLKLTVVEIGSSISSYLHKIFNPTPAAENAPGDNASAGWAGNERIMGASIMGLVVMVIMIVFLKRV